MRVGRIRLALAAALFWLFPAVASPDRLSVDTLGQAGAWSAFRASGPAGDVLCGLDTVVEGGRLVSVELFASGTAVRLFNPDWRFAPGTSTLLQVRIGDRSWEAVAIGIDSLLE